MVTRLWKVALLLLVGLGGLVWPPCAPAQALTPIDDESAALAQKKQEVREMQTMWAFIGGSAVGVALLVIYFLNSANKREKKFSERAKQKQKRAYDPDAPLPYEPTPAEPPPLP
jgi:hypothetical protein